MTDLRTATQQALVALEHHVAQTRPIHSTSETIDALRAALAQPEPEPVAWMSPASQPMLGKDDGTGSAYHIITTSKETGNHSIPLFTAPLQRKPLTDQEIIEAIKHISHNEMSAFAIARAIERIIK